MGEGDGETRNSGRDVDPPDRRYAGDADPLDRRCAGVSGHLQRLRGQGCGLLTLVQTEGVLAFQKLLFLQTT